MRVRLSLPDQDAVHHVALPAGRPDIGSQKTQLEDSSKLHPRFDPRAAGGWAYELMADKRTVAYR
jgi:hypothetical protein